MEFIITIHAIKLNIYPIAGRGYPVNISIFNILFSFTWILLSIVCV